MKRGTILLPALLVCAAPLTAADGNAAGVKWTVPGGWKVQAPRTMRVATYEIPAAPGSEPGECGVFHFGSGQGGSVEENLTRWVQQFEGSPVSKKSVQTVNGFRVHRIDVSGTYLAPSGPMMQSQGKRPNYRLLGAIVEAPRGLVFFKCIGPAPTMAKAQADFDRLIASVAKSATTSL